MRERVLTIAGLLTMTVGFIALVLVDQASGTLRADAVVASISWFLLAAIGFGLVVFGTQQAHGEPWRGGLPWLLGFGLVLRVLLLLTEPTLSDDVYRYLWDGHLVTEGVSPYRYPIASPLADAWDIPARSLANNRSLASPYLPVAHGVFGLVALLLPAEPWSMQVVMLGFEALGLLMIVKLLRRAELPEHRALLYWLNPLVIVEVAHGAHIDAAIVGLGLAGVWATLRASRTSMVGPVLVAAATLTRPLTLLFAPVLVPRWSGRQRLGWILALVVPVVAAGAFVGLGFDDSGTGVFGSARAYSETFRFNSGIYHWLETWIGGRGLDDKGWNEPRALTRMIVAITVAVVMLLIFVAARQPQTDRSTMRLLALPVATYVLLTPVFHPWYLLLLLALVPFLAPGTDESGLRWIIPAPWLALSVLAIFSYLTYEDPNAFAEREWVRRLQWYPTLALTVVAALVGTHLWRTSRTADRTMP